MAASSSDKLTQSRRVALKALGVASAAGALAPFVPTGQFLNRTLVTEKKEAEIANVNDAHIRTPGSTTTFSFPRPAEEDPFSSSWLIHLLPEDAKTIGTEFMAFNRTCVHLRCLYNFSAERNRWECPCHGSVYRAYDAVPVAGPAYTLGLNPEPEVVIRIDNNGDIHAVDLNGEIGYGRSGGWSSETLITPKKYPFFVKKL